MGIGNITAAILVYDNVKRDKLVVEPTDKFIVLKCGDPLSVLPELIDAVNTSQSYAELVSMLGHMYDIAELYPHGKPDIYDFEDITYMVIYGSDKSTIRVRKRDVQGIKNNIDIIIRCVDEYDVCWPRVDLYVYSSRFMESICRNGLDVQSVANYVYDLICEKFDVSALFGNIGSSIIIWRNPNNDFPLMKYVSINPDDIDFIALVSKRTYWPADELLLKFPFLDTDAYGCADRRVYEINDDWYLYVGYHA